jgi:2-dehydropantoate 2-reductase
MNNKANNNQMRIGVIGMGPVGSILVAHLVEAGAFVVPCEINRIVTDKIKKSGIRLEHAIKMKVDIDQACYSVPELKLFDLDLIVIASKAPSLTKVLKQIEEIATDKLHVACAQNGIDNEVEVARAFGDDRTLRMVVNFAGNKSSQSTTHVSFFNPPNYVAPISMNDNAVTNQFVELLNKGGLETQIPEDIQDLVWEKAILNAALSAVCAISRRTMKDVMDFPTTLELVEAIVDESVKVARAEGIELGPKFRRFSIRYLKNAGHHRPSMLTDLEEGHRTEIDQLNGKIVQYGRKHCLPTPLNQAVTALVHLLEYSPE